MSFVILRSLKLDYNAVLGVILLFLLVFGFQIFGINTRYLALFVLIIYALIIPGKCASFMRMLRNKKLFNILLFSLLYFLLSVPITILHLKNDFSFFGESVGVFIVEISTVLFYSIFCIRSNCNILNWLIIIYLIQSLIIFGAFMSPNILDIVRSFQYENAQDIAKNYLEQDIVRGLALSGDLFFGLAASFGFVIILSVYCFIKSQKYYYVLIAFFLSVSSFFVGRTALVGLGIAIILFVISPMRYKIRTSFNIIISLFAVIIGIYVLLPFNVKEILTENVFPYALEMFYSFHEGEGLTTSSTSDLYNMLNSSISISTLLFGDGQFTSATGEYYMRVDVGYFRQIYFSGIFYVIFSIVIVLNMIFPLNISNMKFKYYSLRQSTPEFCFAVCLLMYFLILQIKGLAMMHGKELMALLMLYFLNKNFSKEPCYENYSVLHSTKSL